MHNKEKCIENFYSHVKKLREQVKAEQFNEKSLTGYGYCLGYLQALNCMGILGEYEYSKLEHEIPHPSINN